MQSSTRAEVSDTAPRTMTDLGHLLDDATQLLQESGEDDFGTNRLMGLREQLTDVRLQVAVLGQFKRGKSTFLNALLGERLLPSGLTPVTAIPTRIVGGPKRLIRVIFQDGRRKEFANDRAEELEATLTQFISERANPHNAKHVERVEVEHPSQLLGRGVVFVDTPGIGSTFQHNTATTLDLLPECDAALFVISPDPPVTEVELDFFRAARRHVARVFYVLSKVDYLSRTDQAEMIEFLQAVLTTEGETDRAPHIWPVSARQGLEARLLGDDSLWSQSGMAHVEQELVHFLAEDKERTVELVVAARGEQVVADVLFRLRLQRRALDLSLADLEQRLAMFDDKVAEAEQQRRTQHDVLAGDRTRTLDFINEQAKLLNTRIGERLKSEIEAAADQAGSPDELARIGRGRIAEAIPPLLDELLERERATIDQRLREVLAGHQARAAELVHSIQQSAAELFELPDSGTVEQEALVIRHQPYWVTHDWSSLFNPIPISPTVWERLLPAPRRRARIERRLSSEMSHLVARNVENLRWSMVQNVQDSFRRFGLDLDQAWERIVAAIRSAAEAGRGKRAEMDTGTEQERQRLDQLIERSEVILAALNRVRQESPAPADHP